MNTPGLHLHDSWSLRDTWEGARKNPSHYCATGVHSRISPVIPYAWEQPMHTRACERISAVLPAPSSLVLAWLDCGVTRATDDGCVCVVCVLQGRNGNWRTALSVFDDMQAAGYRPRLTSYTVAISACARAGEWRCALSPEPQP